MTPTEPRRVLIATLSVYGRTGTEVYTRDLALSLLRRGHLPIVYTTLIGPLASELRAAGIPVVDDIEAIAARPDVIHGHHVLETLTALARFRDVPALFVCHDALTWHSVPPSVRRIGLFVAVDHNCRDRMVHEYGVPEHSVRVLLNAVDLARFRRRPPLPPRPLRAVVFSNAAMETGYAREIRAACRARGISLDLLGEASGRPASRPEDELARYDLVFAKARCALEAAAVGAAVVVCDAHGLSGMLTAESLSAARNLNFGRRTLQRPITTEAIGAEIDRYDAADAAEVCDRIRASAGIDVLTEQYLACYDDLCAAPVAVHVEDELADMARALARVSRSLIAQQVAPPPLARLRGIVRNARLLARPVRLARWIRQALRG